jgi:hypothetical protein
MKNPAKENKGFIWEKNLQNLKTRATTPIIENYHKSRVKVDDSQIVLNLPTSAVNHIPLYSTYRFGL